MEGLCAAAIAGQIRADRRQRLFGTALGRLAFAAVVDISCSSPLPPLCGIGGPDELSLHLAVQSHTRKCVIQPSLPHVPHRREPSITGCSGPFRVVNGAVGPSAQHRRNRPSVVAG